MKLKTALAMTGLSIASVFSSTLAQAETGVGIRAGLMGFGADFNFGLGKKLNARLGYNFLSSSNSLDDTGVHYETKLKIDSFSGMLDWHAFDGGFRLTAGAASSGPSLDARGAPTSGSYAIGNGTYSASQIGSVRGEFKIGKSLSPYVGLGYGRIVGGKHRVTFLFDLGAYYVGDLDVSLSATCGTPTSTPTAAFCTTLQNDVQNEIREIKAETGNTSWYPLISFGIGVRF
jgi:outer membrane protein assembly factor BamA